MRSVRNWYQIYLSVLAVGFALTQWAEGGGIISSAFPEWEKQLWFGGLVVSSIAVIVSALMLTITGRLIERAACIMVATLCAGYTVVFLIQGWGTGLLHLLYVTIFLGAFAAVNVIRVFQIRRQLSSLYDTLDNLPTIKDTPR